MKKISLYLLGFIIMGFVFYSCEKEAKNVDVPIVQPQLVVAGFLNPSNEDTRVYLSWSAPIYHTNNHDMPNESNAKVYINDESKEYQLSYNNVLHCYTIDKTQMPVFVGKKYHLRIESSKSKTLVAESIIPDKPNYHIEFAGSDSTKSEYDNGYHYRFYVKLKINSNEAVAYYRIKAWEQNIGGGYEYVEPMSIISGENHIVYGTFDRTLVLESNRMSLSTMTKQIFISIQKVDQTYYRYQNALANYQGVDVFTEPTLVYSNIENGLGVFCSFNAVMDSLQIN